MAGDIDASVVGRRFFLPQVLLEGLEIWFNITKMLWQYIV